MAPPKKLKSLEGIKADKDFDWKAFGEEVALNPERAAFAKKFGHSAKHESGGAASEGYDYFHGNWGRWLRDKNRWDPNRWRRHQNFFKAAWDLWKPPADVTDPDVEGPGSGGDDGGGGDEQRITTYNPELGHYGTEEEYAERNQEITQAYSPEAQEIYDQFVQNNNESSGTIGNEDGSTNPIDDTDPIGDTIPIDGTPAEEAIRQFTATHMRQDPNINPYR